MPVKMLRTDSREDYLDFIRARQCPVYRVSGSILDVPDEYAWWGRRKRKTTTYKPMDLLFDYQRDIVRMSLEKKKFAVFADCGLGKTLMILDWVRHVHQERGGRVLIVSPLMVIPQTVSEAERFYANLPIQVIKAANLNEWLKSGDGIGIINYDALSQEIEPSKLSGLVLDESSMLKSH